ncbi:glycosyltransferase family 4 protein [Pseudoalteromonas peptidolytica]|uniref:Spore protein YkvP/CgeB glycosyl transferase-like domain-containing protein n=1 Tax=Pseudoalteromonas peptidolytica F12-50-A1 TaxID=1315280 RepID=A0A8I0MWR1_9GAMM|nr:glycosyltransferase family 4 protein [Pseudoalteromonas peptidolytica]MBE0346883.1 hypothetical protein [Pseudoalteromonas peptidolytica F12-50-A1]NLR13785.1 glycosyltransferase family 4 protein [Pseudoalteromonas peptidolytica]GEK09523.1 hypothetical protein PPE03_17720 [Pseudoalteromonas peptidolytica]
MLIQPKTFFAIHMFESKPYEDSAGKLEVREPMVQSGLLGEHETYSFGWQEQDSVELVQQSVTDCFNVIGSSAVVIYGAGAHTTQYWDCISRLNVVAIADKNEGLWGEKLNGLPIISPQEIGTYSSNVVISSRAYEDNIYTELSQLYPMAELFKLYGSEFMATALENWCTELKSRVLAFKPDLLIHTPTHVKENIPKSFFINLKRHLPNLKILTIWWDYDEENEESGYLEYERDVLEYADLVIENSNASRLEKMYQGLAPYEKHSNPERVIFHPTWFDPSLFYDCGREPKEIKIALFGSIVGERAYWVDILKAHFGSDFHHFGGVSGEHRNPLPIREYAKLLRSTKIVVNTQTYGFRSQCKGKVREALQCGAILLEQDNYETRVFNKSYNYQNIFYFSSEETLIGEITKLLSSDLTVQRVSAKNICYIWTKLIFQLLK